MVEMRPPVDHARRPVDDDPESADQHKPARLVFDGSLRRHKTCAVVFQ